jgi:hypothetical protein
MTKAIRKVDDSFHDFYGELISTAEAKRTQRYHPDDPEVFSAAFAIGHVIGGSLPVDKRASLSCRLVSESKRQSSRLEYLLTV